MLIQRNLDEMNKREGRREAAEKAKAESEAVLGRNEVEEKERLMREEAEVKWKRNLNMSGAGVPNPFYVNTGVVSTNSGNTTKNIISNSNNNTSVNIGRSMHHPSL